MIFAERERERESSTKIYILYTPARNIKILFRNTYIAATYFLYVAAIFVAGIDADRSKRPCQVFRGQPPKSPTGGTFFAPLWGDGGLLSPVRVLAPDSVNFSQVEFRGIFLPALSGKENTVCISLPALSRKENTVCISLPALSGKENAVCISLPALSRKENAAVFLFLHSAGKKMLQYFTLRTPKPKILNPIF